MDTPFEREGSEGSKGSKGSAGGSGRLRRHFDKTFTTALTGGKTGKPGLGRVEIQSSRDYSSLSHHRTYRSVYGGLILWAGIYSCLPFLPLPENHTQHSFSYLRQFRYFSTGSQSFDCILLQRMNVPFTVYFDRNRSVLPAFAVL